MLCYLLLVGTSMMHIGGQCCIVKKTDTHMCMIYTIQAHVHDIHNACVVDVCTLACIDAIRCWLWYDWFMICCMFKFIVMIYDKCWMWWLLCMCMRYLCCMVTCTLAWYCWTFTLIVMMIYHKWLKWWWWWWLWCICARMFHGISNEFPLIFHWISNEFQ